VSADALGKPVIDNYWQTETGWPILTIANGVEQAPSKFGSPGVAMYGYDVKLLDENSGQELTGAGQKGVVVIEGPLAAGCMQTSWRRRCALRQHLLEDHPGQAGLQHLRLGHPRRGRLLLHPRPHRRRDQRRRPPARHARDRGEHLEPPERRRGGGGRRGRRAEGAGRDGLRRAQGRGALADEPARLQLEARS
jgi:hypothetical protein